MPEAKAINLLPTATHTQCVTDKVGSRDGTKALLAAPGRQKGKPGELNTWRRGGLTDED